MDSEEDGSVHEVMIPDGMEAADWARAHSASAPEIIPERWPESSRMCLLVVYRECRDMRHDCSTRAFLVTRPRAMHAVATAGRRRRQLWFRVPRRLFTADICPTLRPEHWPEEE